LQSPEVLPTITINMIDPEKTEEFKKTLLKRKDEIQQELQGIAIKDPHIQGNWTAVLPQYEIQRSDASEHADEVEEYETRISQEESLELKLRDINGALEKLEKGTYGLCEIGNEPIELARLQAMPEAKTCLKHLGQS